MCGVNRKKKHAECVLNTSPPLLFFILCTPNYVYTLFYKITGPQKKKTITRQLFNITIPTVKNMFQNVRRLKKKNEYQKRLKCILYMYSYCILC